MPAVTVATCKLELKQTNVLWSNGIIKDNVLLCTLRDAENNGLC